MDLNSALTYLQRNQDRPELTAHAPHIAGQMDFSRSNLALLRRAQLHRIAKAWGIPVKADGTKDEVLPAIIAAEQAGILRQRPKRPFYAWLAQFRQDERTPDFDPTMFPDEPDLKDFQKSAAPASVVPASSQARGPGGAVESPTPLSLDEIDARVEKRVAELVEKRAREMAEKMRVADAASIIEGLARDGSLDLNKVMDRHDPAMKRTVAKRAHTTWAADPGWVALKAKAKSLGIKVAARSRKAIEADLAQKEATGGGSSPPA